MGSKLIILLGLFLAVTLLISSEIATARELAETTTVDPSKEADGAAVNDAYTIGFDPSLCNCCGDGCECCSYAGEKVDAEPKN